MISPYPGYVRIVKEPTRLWYITIWESQLALVDQSELSITQDISDKNNLLKIDQPEKYWQGS